MHDHPVPAGRTSLPGMIAWLSVCFLCAALGHTLDARWQETWAELGAFGLASAVGLEALHRQRIRRAKFLRESILKARIDCGLSRLSEESATLDAISSAVRLLNRYAVEEKRVALRVPAWSGRLREQNPLRNHLIEITPIHDDQRPQTSSVPTVMGRAQRINANTILFEHSQPLSAPVAVVTFKFERHSLSFVVNLIWSEKSGSGYLSSGTMLAAGVPDSEPAATAPEPVAT